MVRRSPASVVVLAGLCLAPAAGPSAASPPGPRQLLARLANMTEAEWVSVEGGVPVAKVLETSTREIAVVGAVRIRGGRDALTAHLRDMAALKRSGIVLDAGRFGDVPSVSDLERVPFEDHNLDLRDCRPGNCRVRLSAPEIARFEREVSWDAPGWRDGAAAVWRDVLVSRVRGYAARGVRGLAAYVNKEEPVSVASEIAALVHEFGFVAAYSPELYQYLQDLGPAAPANVERRLYWTREDFGVRPIFRIHDQLLQPASTAPASLIVTSQIYADHYLDAAVGVVLALDAPGGCYMIAMNRARTRSLGGMLRRLVRSTVQGRSRNAMRALLATAKATAERR